MFTQMPQVFKTQRRHATWAEGTRRVGDGAQEAHSPACCEDCWHFGAHRDVHEEAAEAPRQDRRPGSGAAFSSAAFFRPFLAAVGRRGPPYWL